MSKSKSNGVETCMLLEDQPTDGSSLDYPHGPSVPVSNSPCISLNSSKGSDPKFSQVLIESELKEQKLSKRTLQGWDQECRQVFIKDLTSTTLALQLQSNWDGIAIKAAIQEKTGYYPKSLMLTWASRNLHSTVRRFSTNEDQVPLSALKVPHNATIFACIRSPYQVQHGLFDLII
ncbi:hypothetical protein B0J14DRAFT_651881 [Halenospora varia]|nr:hypothetical protein B0J14DRAFT_651881 [Halenospora varia]